MKVDPETAAVLAAKLSGFDVDHWRTLIAGAQLVREIDVEDQSDPTWLSRKSSGWIINLTLARLGEPLHPILSGELASRVETIRGAHNAADSKWLTAPDRIDDCWRTLHTVQQLVEAFSPARLPR